jgi:hypothetical protein
MTDDPATNDTPEQLQIVEAALFPAGANFEDNSKRKELAEQYKVLANHVEQMSERRQVANNFFLSMNSAIFAGMGLLAKESLSEVEHPIAMKGIFSLICVLAIVGLVICKGWTSIIRAHRQLNLANLSILQMMEKYLAAAIFSAQHQFAKKHYVSLVTIEERIALSFTWMYVAFVVGSLFLIAFWHKGGRIGLS